MVGGLTQLTLSTQPEKYMPATGGDICQPDGTGKLRTNKMVFDSIIITGMKIFRINEWSQSCFFGHSLPPRWNLWTINHASSQAAITMQKKQPIHHHQLLSPAYSPVDSGYWPRWFACWSSCHKPSLDHHYQHHYCVLAATITTVDYHYQPPTTINHQPPLTIYQPLTIPLTIYHTINHTISPSTTIPFQWSQGQQPSSRLPQVAIKLLATFRKSYELLYQSVLDRGDDVRGGSVVPPGDR